MNDAYERLIRSFLKIGDVVVTNAALSFYERPGRTARWFQVTTDGGFTDGTLVTFLILGHELSLTIMDETRHYVTDKGTVTLTNPSECSIITHASRLND